MPRQKLSENMPLIATILITVLIVVGAIGLLSLTSADNISQEEKSSILVREDSNMIGKLDSEIEVVEFSDFECPACLRYYPELEQVKSQYSDRIKFVFRHFPLRSIHPLAQSAAEAAEAAGAQGKFWEFHNKLYENQPVWSKLNETEAQAKFVEYAQELGVEDMEKFEFDIENRTYASKVNRDYDDAERLKVQGTPTVYINGKRVANPTFEQISQKLEELL